MISDCSVGPPRTDRRVVWLLNWHRSNRGWEEVAEPTVANGLKRFIPNTPFDYENLYPHQNTALIGHQLVGLNRVSFFLWTGRIGYKAVTVWTNGVAIVFFDPLLLEIGVRRNWLVRLRTGSKVTRVKSAELLLISAATRLCSLFDFPRAPHPGVVKPKQLNATLVSGYFGNG